MTPDAPHDPDLGSLATRIGWSGTPDGLRERLRRLAASPACYPGDSWLRLIAPDADPDTVDALRDCLRALAPPAPPPDPTRLDRLRARFDNLGIDGVILPRSDEHQGEYLPGSALRLPWLSGFTGSAGTALVLRDRAVMFVDGRYTLQAAEQLDSDRWTVEHGIRTPPADYVRDRLGACRLGYDPRLHSVNALRRLADAVAASGGALVPLEPNPIDEIWDDRPAPPLGPVELLPTRFAGVSASRKRKRIAEALAGQNADATVLNQPESIAWLLNLRGGDVPFTPLPLAYAIVDAQERVELFLDTDKCDPETRAALGNQVSLLPFDDIAAAIDRLGQAGSTVRIDPDTATDWMHRRLRDAGATVVLADDPCVLPRARKNAVEIAGSRAAHVRDGAAVARFLKWIDDNAPGGEVTEMAAADALETYRSAGRDWRGPSFPTISGAGPNGAIVHYRVTADSDRALEPGSLYLVDSGAQYLDGTTDITRTVAIGRPTQEMRERFTLVLKGHIALASVRFPRGTSGSQLDALARQFLWKSGLDYDHGTGHGVGAFLGVHEGPQRIAASGRVAIEAGMILSNEPGYYKPGGYGIRIENLLLAVDADPLEDSGRPMLGFETLTFAPIDLRLVERSLLTDEEVAWLNAYHATVRERIAPALSPDERQWLADATAPILD